MVTFKYKSSEILKTPDKMLQQFSMDSFQERNLIIENLKGKNVKVLKDNEVKDCIFINADLTHFTYKFSKDDRSKKTLLSNLVF